MRRHAATIQTNPDGGEEEEEQAEEMIPESGPNKRQRKQNSKVSKVQAVENSGGASENDEEINSDDY